MTYVVTGSNDEIIAEFNTLKPRKAAGPDNLPPKFFLHPDEKCFRWLRLLNPNQHDIKTRLSQMVKIKFSRKF